MMRYSVLSFFGVLFICVTHYADAQDFYGWVKELNQQTNSEKVHIRMDIKISNSDHKLLYETKTEIKKDGKNYYYLYGDMEMLMNESVFLLINHDKEEISVQEIKDERQLEAMNRQSFDLDSLLSMYKDPKLMHEDNRFVTYQVLINSELIDSTEVTIDKVNKTLAKVKYRQSLNYSDDYQYVNIAFEEFNYSPSLQSEDFDEKKYVTISGSKVILAERLKGYEIFKR